MAAVCVFCSSGELIDQSYIALASELGTALAAAGHSLVSGGGRVSMMGAVARAARAGGAATVGVMPVALISREVADIGAQNLVVVQTMRRRKHVMDERSDAFIALPGGIGTLEELFEVWTAAALGMHHKPVVVLDPSGLYDRLWDFVTDLHAQGFVRASSLEVLRRVRTVAEAIALVDAA